MKKSSHLRKVFQAIKLMLGKPQMDLDVRPSEDQRHTLAPGEHEAFYFLFTSADGQISGGLRTLFGSDDVLEIMGLRWTSSPGREYAWMHQQRVAYAPEDQPPDDASGPTMHLMCQSPWERWRGQFDGEAQRYEAGTESLQLDLTFRAITAPARFRLGDYEQVQQDGRLSGAIQTPYGTWAGELISYRDHSWGQRGASDIPGWMILDIPEHLYAFIIGTVERPLFGVGRIIQADGEMQSVWRPRVRELAPGRWQIEDRKVGLAPWTFERLGPAGISYLGRAGQEAVRAEASAGDLFVDKIGPAVFTSPTGEKIVGFWDEARRLD